jgi:hypothetical protein
LTHSKIHAWRPHCFRRQNHTRFFYDFISCLRATSISLPRSWQGTVPRVATAFGHTSQCDTQI